MQKLSLLKVILYYYRMMITNYSLTNNYYRSVLPYPLQVRPLLEGEALLSPDLDASEGDNMKDSYHMYLPRGW